MYVRVQDPASGHQFDRPENDPLIEAGELTLLNSDRWPAVDQARPPKFAIPKAPAVKPEKSAPVVPEATTEKETPK